MSDRFDITLEHKLETKPADGEVAAKAVRRIELITGTGRRRQWSSDDKARIVVESFKPGANVSEVARRHGMSPQQLFAWRREARALFSGGGDERAAPPARAAASAKAAVLSPDSAAAFAQVLIAAPQSSPTSTPSRTCACKTRAGTIEIIIGGTTVRVIGEVAGEALTAVLTAVRRAS